MLTRQTAERVSAALDIGNKASQKIYASLTRAKRGKLNASVHNVRTKEVKELKKLSNNICAKLASSFNSVQDINKVMKIEAANQLLADAAQLRLVAEILDEVLEESDELSELPDELEASDGADAEPDELGTEADLVEDPELTIDSGDMDELDELEAEDDMDELDAEDELDELEAEDDMDELDAEDELDELDAELDTEAADMVVDKVAKAARARKMRAARNRALSTTKNRVTASNNFGFNWNFGKSGR